MKKYDSDYTTLELVEMGYIEEGIKDLVILLSNIGINTKSSCIGHSENEHLGNCMYPYIDFEYDDLSKMMELLYNYKNNPQILIQHRNYENIDRNGKYHSKELRIFPYCDSLEEGQKIFKDFETYLKEK